MRYLSVCSGIEAATVAWHPLGWTPVAFSEIEPFPAAVLAYHYPDVPNYGDMTKHKEWPLGPGAIDLLVGGTPCQSFSVAGLRKGISDPRGGLMLTYLEIARRLRPRWLVWENVPGVLSSGGGRDFGSFLGALGELGYGWAYRVLDAQWVRTHGHPRAVPQRRRRVFVVGCLGDWERAASVLFERESVQRDSAPRRAQGQGSAADAEAGARAGCYWDGSDIANTLTRKGCDDRMPDKERLFAVLQPVAVDVADSLVARNNQTTGFQTEVCAQPIGYRWQNDRDGLVEDGTAPFCRASAGSSGFHEMNHPVVLARDNAAHAAVVNMQGSKSNACVSTDGSSFTLNAMHGHDVHAVAFQACGDRDKPSISVSDTAFCLPANAMSDRGQAVAHALRGEGFDAGEDGTGRGTPLVPTAMTVRRLTPIECSRLQGFPDDWTLIPWRKKAAADCPDGPRYKALGNSMAVNCMAWIGERIAAVEARNDR